MSFTQGSEYIGPIKCSFKHANLVCRAGSGTPLDEQGCLDQRHFMIFQEKNPQTVV